VEAVSRDTWAALQALAPELSLPAAAPEQLADLLEGLAAEPDPHTTVSDPARALDVHIRDSLSALAVPAMRDAQAVVDIGAGAGFPGLPLAIALPAARFDLVESASRKTAVIGRLAAAAALENVRPIHARVEEWAAGEGARAYDLATARAVAPLAVLVEYAAPLLSVGGIFVAWKGSPEPSEIGAGARAASELGLAPLDPVSVEPFATARDLNLYLYSKVGETPKRFPRRPGIALKRPLGA
jgi:16S rRNA (guanine527-N7)-methyltransferase